MDIKGTLDSLQIDIDGISDEPTRNIVIILSHLIEYLSAENKQLKEENQALRDEINKLLTMHLNTNKLPNHWLYAGFMMRVIIKN